MKPQTLADIQVLIQNRELVELLDWEEKEGYVLARPKTWLGSETFKALAEFFHAIGGEYVSAGKQSHFRVRLGEKPSRRPLAEIIKDLRERIQELEAYL